MEETKAVMQRLLASMRTVKPTSVPEPSASKTECPACRDTGWKLVTVGLVTKAAACECQPRRKIAYVIPREYQSALLTDFPQAAIDAAMQWYSSGKLGLFLCGAPGRGKTHFACALLRALLEIGQDGKFYDMAKVYRQIRNCFNSEMSEEQMLEHFIDLRWLILDDFGAGSFSDFERRYALELLKGRESYGRRTIITCNLSLEEIQEKLDQRVASRLAGFTKLELGGRDRRAGA